MARRNFNPARYLPIWTTAQTATVNLAFMGLLDWLGVNSFRSYFSQLRIAISASTVLCAWYGASTYDGGLGFVLGGLCGLAAPIALLWLSVLLAGIVIFLALYAIAMGAVLYVLWWFLTGLLGR